MGDLREFRSYVGCRKPMRTQSNGWLPRNLVANACNAGVKAIQFKRDIAQTIPRDNAVVHWQVGICTLKKPHDNVAATAINNLERAICPKAILAGMKKHGICSHFQAVATNNKQAAITGH